MHADNGPASPTTPHQAPYDSTVDTGTSRCRPRSCTSAQCIFFSSLLVAPLQKPHLPAFLRNISCEQIFHFYSPLVTVLNVLKTVWRAMPGDQHQWGRHMCRPRIVHGSCLLPEPSGCCPCMWSLLYQFLASPVSTVYKHVFLVLKWKQASRISLSQCGLLCTCF